MSLIHWAVGERTRCGLLASKVETVTESSMAECYRCCDGWRVDEARRKKPKQLVLR